MNDVEDVPEPCPECGHVALLPLRAAEVSGPLMYLCGNCHETVPVDAHDRWLASLQIPPVRRLTLRDRLTGVLHDAR